MLMLPGGIKVFLALEPIDMRKSFDGLAALVQMKLNKDAACGNLFVFCNKSRDKVKVLYWDRNGFCLWYKRLAEGRYRLPRSTSTVITLSISELNLLLEGIDLTHRQRLQAIA